MCRLALYGAPELLSCYCHNNEGGKSGAKFSLARFVWACFPGGSLKIHWHLSFVYLRPRPLPSRPLFTTFVHILRLNRLLSMTKLWVKGAHNSSFQKAL